MPNAEDVKGSANVARGATAQTDLIISALRAAIGRGDCKPGEPLRQDRIAQRFGVSHIPVREAFRQLAMEGLVVALHNRGAAVSSLSIREVEELTDLRCLLEVQMMIWAGPHLSRHDLDQAEAHVEKIDAAQTVDEIIQLNAELHYRLYVKADRPHILSIIEKTRLNLERYLRIAWDKLDDLSRSQDEHRQILSLCRLGAEDELRSLLESHIRRTGILIARYLANAEKR